MVWHSKFQLYELLQYLFPEFKEHLSFQEFSLARNMLNRKLILQTGTSDSNSAPKLQHQFETLSIDLKNAILERNVQIYELTDLIQVLDDITKEAKPNTLT